MWLSRVLDGRGVNQLHQSGNTSPCGWLWCLVIVRTAGTCLGWDGAWTGGIDDESLPKGVEEQNEKRRE